VLGGLDVDADEANLTIWSDFRVAAMLSREHRLEELQSAREEVRDVAEREMRQTSAALVESILDEAVEHQVEALPALAKREAEKAEVDTGEALADLLLVLTAPARAGFTNLAASSSRSQAPQTFKSIATGAAVRSERPRPAPGRRLGDGMGAGRTLERMSGTITPWLALVSRRGLVRLGGARGCVRPRR
jgi:uncharacterized protein with beta-barrel porin domain